MRSDTHVDLHHKETKKRAFHDDALNFAFDRNFLEAISTQYCFDPEMAQHNLGTQVEIIIICNRLTVRAPDGYAAQRPLMRLHTHPEL